ncbi:MAG: 16S rRNA (adenine(1518)-N(6)/adenine(1519)-N(6))-dimethyltransferase RsmA [Candidatus Caldatribacteriaceae bacterium]
MPGRRLGQYFLVDQRVLELIVEAGELEKEDLVLEVGVGEGVLTEAMARKAGWVVGFEIDPLILSRARERLLAYPQVVLYREDFLRMNLLEIVRSFPARRTKCIANIPYGISSPFFLCLLRTTPEILWERFVVMVQREFGEKLLALPPRGKGNPLSVGIHRVFSVERLFVVPPSAFRPNPKVFSLVLRGKRKKDPPFDFLPFLDFVFSVFRHRRKTLQAILPEIGPSLPELKKKRAEDLTLEEWEKLWSIMRVRESHAEKHLGGG